MNQAANWPVIADLAAFNADPNSGTAPVWNELNRSVAITGFSCDYGRQYELNDVQTGSASIDVTDQGELLNPMNTTSLFNSGTNLLVPRRQYRRDAWWPLAGNILTDANTAHPDAVVASLEKVQSQDHDAVAARSSASRDKRIEKIIRKP